MATNCLAVADAKWLNAMSRIKQDESKLNLLNSYKNRRICVLLQIPILNSIEK